MPAVKSGMNRPGFDGVGRDEEGQKGGRTAAQVVAAADAILTAEPNQTSIS